MLKYLICVECKIHLKVEILPAILTYLGFLFVECAGLDEFYFDQLELRSLISVIESGDSEVVS